MRSRRIGLAAAGIVVAFAVPALAGPALPVFVYNDPESGRVGVGAGTPAHPIAHAGADVPNRTVCAGLSYQTTQCVDLGDGAQGKAQDAPPAPPKPTVTVDHDASDGSVGVYTAIPGQPLVGARYNTTNGELCAGFSYQVPFCLETGIGTSG